MALSRAKCSYMAPVIAAAAPKAYAAMLKREAAIIREIYGLGRGVAAARAIQAVCAVHPRDQIWARWERLLRQLQFVQERPPRHVRRWMDDHPQ